MVDTLYLAAGAALAGLGAGGYLALRKRKQLALRKRSGLVDPVAEAEVFMAYDQVGKARELLEAAIIEQPTNVNAKLLLIKIYGKENDKAAYERIARELQPFLMQNELMLWEKIARLGRKMDPNNGLYQPTMTQLQQQA
ncbi:MAG: hypothetical protein U1F63_09200 [Chitinivorax sp.]